MPSSDPDKSLSDDATFAGPAARRSSSEISLGDEQTVGDEAGVADTVLDGIEVSDLTARFRVERTLGRGGMGEVLLAIDMRLGRRVAIKRILGEAADNRMAVARFFTEAKAIAALNHPNIVQIHEFGRAPDGPFLIMEYVEGGTLSERCKAGPISLEESISLACQICDGLGKAHDQGIIHRDIKPANILLTGDGIPKLTDFGLARHVAVSQRMTVTRAVMGTPDFMPPEQQRAASLVDHRSDLWSLAATVYEMVTGRSPKVIRFDLLPAALTQVLGKALEEEKDSRYQSARELREALQGVRKGPAKPGTAARVEGVRAEGECTACGTVNADLSRKFCRNCGASLRIECLKCDKQIPVWEVICGECGTNQPQVIADMRAELEKMKATADEKLAAFAFDEAIQIAEKMAATSHAELGDLARWGRDFAATAADERNRQLAAAAGYVQDARAHMSAFDYPAAIQSLESIAGPLFGGEASTLLSECRSRQDESMRLIAKIGEKIKRKEVDGLLPLVERTMVLRGDRADVAKIHAQLVERRNASVARARMVFESGDARQAVALLARVSQEDFDDDARRLLTTVQQATRCENDLAAAVQAAKTDGQVTVEKARRILELGERCLELNPRNEKVRAVIQQCNEVILKAEVSQSIQDHGAQHIETARAINRQAVFCINQDKPEKAEPLLKQALAIITHLSQGREAKVTDGAAAEEEGLFLRNLAVCYENQGKTVEAEALYKRSLAIREKVLGTEHPDTIESITNLAVCYGSQGKQAEAEPLYERALAVREKALGPEHPSTAESIMRLAVCHGQQAKYAEAEPLYERSLSIRQKVLGPEHPETAVSVRELAICFYSQGKYAEAEPLYEQAIAIREKVLGPDHLETAESVFGLALCLYSQEKYAEAEPLFKRALGIREKVHGPDHPDTDESIYGLATCLYSQEKYAEAEPLYERALAIREKVLGRDHPDTVSRREGLRKSRDAQAFFYLNQALTEVTPEVADVLRYFSGPLFLDHVTSLEPEVAGMLAKHDYGYLSLNGLSAISRDVAAALAEYRGRLVLDGLTTLTPEVADAFAAFVGEILFLDGLTELSPQAAERLTQCNRGVVFGALSLGSLANMPPETLAALVKHAGPLSLGGLRQLTPESAATLATHTGDQLAIDGVTQLTPEIAETLARRERGLHLNGLTSLARQAAESLWKCGDLDLNGLTKISPDVAECLARCDGTLGLGGLTEITPEVAEALAKRRGTIDLSGIVTLTPEVAKALSSGDDFGGFNLPGLQWLPEASFDVLQANNLPMNLTVLYGSVGFESRPVCNSVGMVFQRIPGGSFVMGDARGADDETPHRVILRQSFHVGVHEVTNAQWRRVMGPAPSQWQEDDRPVEHVSWHDAVEFCQKLSELPEERAVGHAYRLPTEAEWEFACRAGTTSRYSFGNDESLCADHGWMGDESGETHPVGLKKPNAWGLYDMHGNVSEWCSDWYGTYPDDPDPDPQGPAEGSHRVSRGGCWLSAPDRCRSAARQRNDPAARLPVLGVRVVFTSSVRHEDEVVPPELPSLDDF